MPPNNTNNVKPNVMHLLDVTVDNNMQELNMSKFQIVNLRNGEDEADAVNVSQLKTVERKFDEEVIGVKASITSHGNRLTTHDSQLTVIEAIVNHPDTGNNRLDSRMDSIESAFGLGPDGINGADLLQKIKDAYILINNVADSDIASTLTTLFNKDVELAKKIVDEYERATTAERTITDILSNETEERIKEDGLIRLDFAKADKDLETALSLVIKTESDRAKAAEDVLLKKVEDETTRATGAETDLKTLIDGNRTYSDEQDAALSNQIDAEFNRATLAEADLLKKVEDETTRATGAETDLKTLIDGNKNHSDEQNAALDLKIVNAQILLGAEDVLIREEVSLAVSNLKDEFNGVLNSTNENLSHQIKNVADTLASLLTKLFGKNDKFTSEIIIKESVLIE
jgi:hypothetical protein